MRFVLLLLVACASAPRAKPTSPADVSAEVALASRLGRLLYLHDQAAWQATDRAMPEQQADPRSLGWVVTGLEEDRWLVTFVQAKGDTLAPLYRVERVGEVTTSHVVDDDDVLTDEELTQYRAFDKVRRSDFMRCAPAYNLAVLPASLVGKTGWLIYLMPAQNKPKTVISGGFHRVHVGNDGEIATSLSFTKACLEGAFSDGPGSMVIVTQLVGPAPTEVHVFNSLTHRIPIVVVSDSGFWIVEGASIRPYDPGP